MVLSDDAKKRWEDFYLILIDKLADLLKSEKLLTYYLLNTDTKRFTLFLKEAIVEQYRLLYRHSFS